MKKSYLFLVIMVVLTLFTGIAAADDDSDTSYTYVTVTGVEYDPEVFMPYDTGTITVTVKNTGDESVAVSRAELYSSDIKILNEDSYDTVGAIGAGNSMSFTFTVTADSKSGIYYPRFYLDFKGSNSLSYNIPLKVDDTGLSISVIDAPDSWQEDVSEDITIRVGNPGESTADGVIVYASGDGIETSETSFFVGALEPNEYMDITFEVTPSKETTLELSADWKNGMNSHTSQAEVSVKFGDDKTGADMIINNVEVSGGTVTGDVSNAGLEDAYSVIVTVGSPAEPSEPYKQYVLGSLEPDDFSSFEVTYTMAGSGSAFPLIITWKDENGNSFSSEYTVSSSGQSLTGASSSGGDVPSGISGSPGGPGGSRGGFGMMGGMGSGFANIPIFEIIIGIIAIIGLAVAWKKGILAKGARVVREKLNKGDRK